MAVITAAELKFYETTTGPHRGGAITTTEVTPSTLFDAVTGAEASAGSIEYRGCYFKNTSANANGLQSAKIWIERQTPGADDVAIALAGEGAGVTIETIADYNTAPAGESFTAPTSFATGLSLGTLAQNGYYGVWLKRNVPASCPAFNDDGSNSLIIKVQGDSSA